MSKHRRSYLEYLRLASAHRRAKANDVVLAASLAFVAGAVNAGGFFAIGQYTSHMTGVVSALADNLAVGGLALSALLAGMLAAFTCGAAGLAFAGSAGFAISGAVLLCFVLGLQNATITKISGARMRTTHLTGMVTDIGIELGKGIYPAAGGAARADWDKLSLLCRIVGMFFLGGLSGALAFAMAGYWFVLPLAGLLFLFSILRVVVMDEQ
jgi:uncharacterized membrane protein YoaK (UPF0700 family)